MEEQNSDNNPENNYERMQNNEENLVISQQQQPQQSQNQNLEGHTIWYYLSFITWFLYLISAWKLFLLHKNNNMALLGLDLGFVNGLTAVISTIGFVLYFKKTTLEKDQNIIEGMLGDISKFHSIPLLFVMISFLISETLSKSAIVFELILSIISCLLLFFIYLKTDFNSEWYVIITTKKGLFSCLIALTWYYFWLSFHYLGDSPDFQKGSGIAFSILIGLGNLCFSFFFKDLLVSIINFLIYLGMSLNFYYNGAKEVYGAACGVIDIIVIIINICVLGYLLIMETENLFRS